MADSMPPVEPDFSDEEWDVLFGSNAEPIPKRRISRRAKIIALVAALAMMGGTATTLLSSLQNFATVSDPAEIRTAALERVEESEWGWLVSDVVVIPIDDARVGAFVTNNPPDGVVQVDFRPWNEARLDRLMDHEMGHLLDFAVWGAASSSDRRGGLRSEAWAECAAVTAGTRPVDRAIADSEYHCTADELALYEETLSEITTVCLRWGSGVCRER